MRLWVRITFSVLCLISLSVFLSYWYVEISTLKQKVTIIEQSLTSHNHRLNKLEQPELITK